MRVRWTPAAAADLQDISDYLKEHNPSYRAPTMRKLYATIRDLKQWPGRGRPGRCARLIRAKAVAPGATLIVVTGHATKRERTFKTAWFTKAARKAHISDEELCAAIHRVMFGQRDDLGGGVFKVRLKKNQYRSIILERAGQYWVYEYLFAKQDRANIADDELADFRKLVKVYATLTTHQINQLILEKDWLEICHGNQTQIQD